MAFVTRKIFLEARNCVRKAWLMARDRRDGVPDELTEHQEFMIDSGEKINALARKLFAGGVLVEETDGAAAAAQTRELMDDPAVGAIFNAAFTLGPLVARPDIIARDAEGGGWKLIDVKNSPYYNPKTTGKKRPRSRSGKYFTEVGFNYMIMIECEVRVTGVSIMFVSRRYRLGMSERSMFTEYECAFEAEKLRAAFEKIRGPIVAALAAENEPEAAMTTICKNCRYYEGCPVSAVRDPIFLFNSINQKRFLQMIEDGYRSIADIPPGYFKYPADGLYYMMRESIVTGKPFIGPDFKKALDAVRWPAHYLDFESLAMIIPVYRGGIPYEHLLVQYSLHVKESPDSPPDKIRHYEFIAEPGRDCRYDLFKSLVKNIGARGSIVVYSDFEKLCIKRAAERFPKLREALTSMADRVFDLCEFMRKHYYHPDFKGLYSIKKTLPVLVPGMSYDSLGVANGADAIVRHYELAAGRLDAERRESARRELLEYCAHDTMAMLKIHESLIEIANNRGRRPDEKAVP